MFLKRKLLIDINGRLTPNFDRKSLKNYLVDLDFINLVRNRNCKQAFENDWTKLK